MALFRKLFYRKPPDGLLEICERVYVFDSCFSSDVWEEENYKPYVRNVIAQLRDNFPDVSILIFNFHSAETRSLIANILSEYDITIMDYPRHYEGCPLLSMEVIHHFLRSSESWLSLGLQNVLLMHCERGGWPILTFMLAALLIYRRHYTGEQKTLDMIYKQAPRELLHLLTPLNPIPSQLRYLQYVSRRNVGTSWPPLDRPVTLDCVILRMIPNFDGNGGCRPTFRIYGQDPFLVGDRNPKLIFSTPKKSKPIRHYKQAECELVKIDISCHIQGDVVLECISLNDDMEQEQMMFRVMFNTAFIRSNIVMLNRDEIDTMWDSKDQFPKDFRAEILFSEMDAAASVIPANLSCFEEKDGLPVEAFAKVQEIFNSVDWLSPKGDAALNVLQKITAATMMQEKLESSSPQENQSQFSPKSYLRPDTSEQKGKEVSSAPETETLSLDTVILKPPPLPTKDRVDSILEPPYPTPVPHEPVTPPLPDKAVTVSISSPPPPPTQALSPAVILSTDETTTTSDPPPLHHTMQEVPPMTWERDSAAKEGSAPTSSSSPHTPSPPTPPPGSSSPPTPIPSTQYSDDRVLRSVPPPPPPPPLTPNKKDNFASMSGECRLPCSPLSPSKEDLTSIGVPPPPPHSTPLLKESTASTCREFEPPPFPPSPLKGSISSIHGSPAPAPPPPLLATETASSKKSAAVPPPPPPPALSSSMKPHTALPQNVPSAPPPPTPFINGETKAGTSVSHSEPMPPGPPPPSIPPPGMRGKELFSRAISTINSQTKKLKPLHWLKISRAVQGSLWAETQKSETVKAPEIDISELESLFSAAVPNSDKRKGNSKTSLGAKPEKVQLIDHRRAYNCEIMLTKVKVPMHDLLSSVLALEDSAIDADQVESIIKFCPTKEEMEMLKGYKGPKDKLGKCEQFFLELMQVPRIQSKLRVFSFKLQFQSQVSDVRKSLITVNSAADQIRGSAKLKRIMQTILSLGNALNQGTARGSAVGFRLDSLLKLTETRARNNKMTLMHYLCKQVLSDKMPELLDFSKDLSSLEPSSKIHIKFLAEEMQAISKGLEKVIQELSMSESDGQVSESFCKALKEFLCYAEGEVRSLALLYSGVGRNVDALILYFGEDPSRCSFEQVISTLLNFVKMFNQAHDENCKQLEFEKKKAEKEAAAEKLKTSDPVKETPNVMQSISRSVK
ncbi:formin-like protein 18 isoform X3 [Ipomoea triloba]|uniref:formin-like protein 18 isoform X3 n=1 Tax=Ipomoea triloba TaxID=35885 RepID=UPI00125E433F|nr:formin-like protein 18 isoform X3 [Ipomoea triloba]